MPSPSRITCLFMTALVLGSCGDSSAPEIEPDAAEETNVTTGPPVIVVVLDTWRHDSLGILDANGQSITPNLDQVAAGAVRFEQAQSASGWTLPSVASLLTGTWPTVHKARGKKALLIPIAPDLPTAAEVFQAAGYQTLAVANAAFLSHFLGLDRGFDEFNHCHAYNDHIRRADRSVDDALDMLDEAKGTPFLLLHLFDSHLDYDPPEATAGRYSEGMTGPPPPLSMHQCRALGSPDNPDAPANVEYMKALYHEEIAFVDQELGRLVEELKRRDLWDSCLFVITADHGEEFWEHGQFEHGHTLYDELVHVPLVVKLPGGRAAGTVVDAPVRVLDTMPTLFEEAGLEVPDSFVGSSLLPLVRGEGEEDRVILFESTLYGDELVALRRGPYKLIMKRTREGLADPELFHIGNDPGETTNLAETDPATLRTYRAELRKTIKSLHQAAQQVSDPTPKNMSPGQVDMIQESLRSLGYLAGEDE